MRRLKVALIIGFVCSLGCSKLQEKQDSAAISEKSCVDRLHIVLAEKAMILDDCEKMFEWDESDTKHFENDTSVLGLQQVQTAEIQMYFPKFQEEVTEDLGTIFWHKYSFLDNCLYVSLLQRITGRNLSEKIYYFGTHCQATEAFLLFERNEMPGLEFHSRPVYLEDDTLIREDFVKAAVSEMEPGKFTIDLAFRKIEVCCR